MLTDSGGLVFEQVQRQEQRPVAVVDSHAAAELLVTTLQVHGMVATTGPVSIYPSLDWVEGFAVAVAPGDEQRASELLRALGHEPLGR